MQIFRRRQLETALAEYVDHYNGHRPHRSLKQTSSFSIASLPPLISSPNACQLRRWDRLGGLIHEHELTA